MKNIVLLAVTLPVMLGVVSCEKNSETSLQESDGKYRQVTISAGSAQTRTSVSGGNLVWSSNDTLSIVPQSGSVAKAELSIKDGVGEAEGTFQGYIDETVTDDTDLYGWCGGKWTYSSGSFSVNMSATQSYVENGLAENAYPSIGTGTITSGISLSNPMGVLKLSVMGAMAGDKVKSIAVTSAANNLAGSFSVDNSTFAVSGGSSKTVTLNVDSPYVALSLTEAVNFYIVIPPAEYAANDLTVKITFSDDTYLNYYLSEAVTVTTGGATEKEISDHTGRIGKLNNQEWVMIRAKYDGTNDSYLKWATQNLAVTTSGEAKWRNTDYIIGDFFQWAASYSGYNTTAVLSNLVLYTSFTINGASGSFVGLLGSKKFAKGCAPYGGVSYTKYTSGSSILSLSDPCDDVARIVLGSTWRMPTGGSAGEFKAMYGVTKWTWDDTDKGYYLTKSGVDLASDKSNALLFFPATGFGDQTALSYAGSVGNYWSSTHDSSSADKSYLLNFGSSGAGPEHSSNRYFGGPVRPVSD